MQCTKQQIRLFLESLEAIQNDAIRIATEAFRTSKVESLRVIANEIALQQRREKLILRYNFKLKCHILNPAYNFIVNRNLEQYILSRSPTPTPIILSIRKALTERNMPTQSVLPYHTPTNYTWKLKRAEIDVRFTELPRWCQFEPYFLHAHKKVIEEEYDDRCIVYTDVSNASEGVGAAAVWEDGEAKVALTEVAFIFTAEMQEIKLALKHIHDGNR